MSPDSDIDFKELFEKYSPSVRKYLLKLSGDLDITEDLLQEVFFAVYRYYHTYSPQKGSFNTWLGTVTRNVFIRQLKKRKEETVGLPDEIADEQSTATEEIDNGLLRRDVRRLIAELPEPQRSIIEYKYYQNMTLKECSDRLGISESTVSRRLIEAYKLLRDLMRDRDLDPTR